MYVGVGGDHTETISANLGGGDTTWGGSAWASVGAALVATLWPYDGFANANYIVEELRRPQRLPHIIVTAVGGVTLIYLAINIGYLAVLPERGTQERNPKPPEGSEPQSREARNGRKTKRSDEGSRGAEREIERAGGQVA